MQHITECLRTVQNRTGQLHLEASTASRFAALNFTPFRFMRHGEVPTTHLLAFFLSDREDHGQGDLYLQLFLAALRRLGKQLARLPAGRWLVRAEERHDIGQIDLLLVHEGKTFAICIENKPLDTTGDQLGQLTRYQRHIELFPDSLLLYLSRTPRPPRSHSIKLQELTQLQKQGRYLNITYQAFLLPLLDEWREQTYPEPVRLFLRQFRYHLEEWLDLGNTKPFTIMQDDTIGDLLAASPDQVAAAFQINRSMQPMKEKLLASLMDRLRQLAPGISGQSHWHWKGFGKAVGGQPFLIRPEQVRDANGHLYYPWGRYSVCIEWYRYELTYGIRFDVRHQNAEDADQDAAPDSIRQALARHMPEPGKSREWWPWYALAGPANEEALYTGLASGELVDSIAEKVRVAIEVLKKLSADALLHPVPAT